MAIYQLTLRQGIGAFVIDGSEIAYDTTPAKDGLTVGGYIDFTERSSPEPQMLQDNSGAGLQDQADRSQAVVYGGFSV